MTSSFGATALNEGALFSLMMCSKHFDRLEQYVKHTKNLTVNIGSHDEITVKELAEQIVRISGKSIDLKFDPSNPACS